MAYWREYNKSMTSDFLSCLESEYNLQNFNSLAVPARARWLATITCENQLLDAIQFARGKNCPLLVMGGGSNLLLPDRFNGLVIRLATQGRKILRNTDQMVEIEVAGGENWHQLVTWSVLNNYSGLENLALIPGSVGAAPIQNIGAYGAELGNCLIKVEALDIATGSKLEFSNRRCQFGYRDSIFKRELRGKVIITKVVLKLQKRPQLNLNYPALAEYLGRQGINQPTVKDVCQAVVAIRQSKLPDPEVIPNAGSFFKNPILSAANHQRLKNQYPNLVSYPTANHQYKIAAAWLLEQAGWKGKMVDGIAMHDQQALVLVNPNRCNSRQVIDFASQVQLSIKQQFDVALEIEPLIVNNTATPSDSNLGKAG